MGEYINTLEDLCTILKITPGFFKYILYVKKKKYKPISIPKKDGTARLIEIPCDEIKIVQRRLLKFLEDNYEFLDILRNNNYLKDKIGYINDKKYQILDIDELGRLKVIDENKEISYIYSGEVSLSDFYNSLH